MIEGQPDRYPIKDEPIGDADASAAALYIRLVEEYHMPAYQDTGAIGSDAELFKVCVARRAAIKLRSGLQAALIDEDGRMSSRIPLLSRRVKKWRQMEIQCTAADRGLAHMQELMLSRASDGLRRHVETLELAADDLIVRVSLHNRKVAISETTMPREIATQWATRWRLALEVSREDVEEFR